MYKNLILVTSLFVMSSGAVLAQDASVGVGAAPTTRQIISLIAGKNVYIERPRGSWSRYLRDEAAESAMKKMVGNLGGLRVLDRREADLIMVGTFTVDLARRQRKGGGGQIDLSGIIPRLGQFGQFVPRRVDLESRDEKWDLSGEVDFDFARVGRDGQPSKVVLQMYGQVERKAVRSTDQQLRTTYGRWFSGAAFELNGASDTEPEYMAKATLAGTFENAKPLANPAAKRVAMAVSATRFSLRLLKVAAGGDQDVAEGQVVTILSEGVKVGRGRVSYVSADGTITIEINGDLDAGREAPLEVEF